MPEKGAAVHQAAPAAGGADHKIKEAVCIHTQKIYDACRDKDCFEDLHVYFTVGGQAVIDRATSVKCHRAELIWCSLDVESVAFNRGFYSVDVKYFFRVTVDAYMGMGRPVEVAGLATFDKRVILFGSEGNAKIFYSTIRPESLPLKANMPTAVVEAVDPICLGVKLSEGHEETSGEYDLFDVPEYICDFFNGDDFVEKGEKHVLCTLGQFTMIRLERDTQLVIPFYDFVMPEKECIGSTEGQPCELFKRIKFPVDEFFPQLEGEFTEYRDLRDSLCK